MIKMRAKTEIKGGDKFARQLREELKKYSKSYVTIGVHDDAGKYPDGTPEVFEVALWNEFGTKKTPERSFMRSAVDDNEGKINALREEAISNIFTKNWTILQALKFMGENIQLLVQNKIKSNVPPPYGTGKGNASPEEIEARQRAKAKKTGGQVNTLIESGLMLRSITYKVHLER